MGSGICEICARSGFEVVFSEANSEAVDAGRERIARSLARAVERGRLEQTEADAVLGRISGTTDFDGLAGCDLVFEAVPEHLDLKKQVFSRLDAILSPEAILATNTSSLPVIDMAVATSRPERVIGFHFFNPAQIMKLVELVHTVATDAEVIQAARDFAQGLGKVPVACRDRAGFIANVLLFPYLNEAVRMFEQGYASREDIDAAMQLGCGHPLGPLSLLDLIGLDSGYEICEALWRQFRDETDAPAPLIKQYVVAGYLGRKTGRGFYRYEKPESSKVVDLAEPGPADLSSDVRAVGLVGTGLMAVGIAEVAARAGNRVLLRGRTDSALREAMDSLAQSVQRSVDGERMNPEEAAALLDRVSTTLDIADLAECDLVVEAVSEDLETKSQIFQELDRAVKPEAILATSTSSLSVVDLGAVTDHPERVVGLHFFNPAPVMQLVEVVRTVASSPEAESRASAWVRSIGKQPVHCRDRAGFIVNFLLFPYLNDAVRMHEEGYSTPEEIDTAMKLGCAHPMGPFELMDIIGLDVTYAVLTALHQEFRERRLAPAPLLEHMVRAGFLGRKTGRGFYEHPAPQRAS
jgi:3-hydroxybutyryl-CoA dehydrogenase